MQSNNNNDSNPQSIITNISSDNDDVPAKKKVRTSPSKYTKSRQFRLRLRSLVLCCLCKKGVTRKEIKPDSVPESKVFLPSQSKNDEGKICLVVDLDETLVHSTFKVSKDADFVVPVMIEFHLHKVYVKKRPYVDKFIEAIGPLFECVLFTASLSKYADPVVNLLDKKGTFRFRLFRDSCSYKKGYYTKDLSLLGRDMSRIIILDNSPNSYMFHKQNALPITTWIDDQTDTELMKMLPLLNALSTCNNIYDYLPRIVSDNEVNLNFQEIFNEIQNSKTRESSIFQESSNKNHSSFVRRVKSDDSQSNLHKVKIKVRNPPINEIESPIFNVYDEPRGILSNKTTSNCCLTGRASNNFSIFSDGRSYLTPRYRGSDETEEETPPSHDFKLSKTVATKSQSSNFLIGSKSLIFSGNKPPQNLKSCDGTLIFSPMLRNIP